MSPRFLAFMPFIFEWEGGYDNDPDDPGGETNFGIDKCSHPGEDIRHLTKDRASEIYFESYWQKNRCEELPAKVGEVVMNIAVNCGSARAGRWLQQTLNTFYTASPALVVDGDIGQVTVTKASAAPAAPSPGLLAYMLLARTEEHYRSIARGRLAKYLRGWLNRNDALRKWISRAALTA